MLSEKQDMSLYCFLSLIMLMYQNRIDIDIVSVYNCIKTIFFIIYMKDI